MKVCAEEADDQIAQTFVIKNMELLQVETYNYLGVLVDVNLSQYRKTIAYLNAKLVHFRKIRLN